MAAQNTASPRNRTNLLQRKQTWYARYYVPKHLQAAFGRAEVQRTLGTRDKLEAHRRLPATLAELQREVAEVVNGREPVDYGNTADVLRELDAISAKIKRGEYPQPHSPGEVALVDMHLDELLDAHAARVGAVDPEDGPLLSDLSPEVIERFAQVQRLANDPTYKSLGEWAAAYITHLQGRQVKDGTWKAHERRLRDFIHWAGAKRDPRQLGDSDAVAYRDRLSSAADLSTRVRKDVGRSVRGLFEWLRKDRKLIRYNPFADLAESVLPNPSDKRWNRRAWHAEELVTIITRLNPETALWSIFVIALYSGLRINEVCSLRLENVAKNCFSVEPDFAKNDNSVRIVPIHPLIAPLVATLVATSYDGHLISGLVPGGQDQRRGAYPSKRFSIHKRTLGLTDPRTTFHSTRHSFATAAERAGIPTPTIEKLTGHSRQTITLDRYSDGPAVAALREAVARISYDREESEDHRAVAVDALVEARLVGFSGNKAWKRGYGRDLLPPPSSADTNPPTARHQ